MFTEQILIFQKFSKNFPGGVFSVRRRFFQEGMYNVHRLDKNHSIVILGYFSFIMNVSIYTKDYKYLHIYI